MRPWCPTGETDTRGAETIMPQEWQKWQSVRSVRITVLATEWGGSHSPRSQRSLGTAAQSTRSGITGRRPLPGLGRLGAVNALGSGAGTPWFPLARPQGAFAPFAIIPVTHDTQRQNRRYGASTRTLRVLLLMEVAWPPAFLIRWGPLHIRTPRHTKTRHVCDGYSPDNLLGSPAGDAPRDHSESLQREHRLPPLCP